MWLTVWTAIPLVHDGSIAPPELAMLALFTLAAFESVMPLPGAFQALGEGKRLAIIGPTGSGKSTTVHLMLRFWEPESGRIMLGGEDIARLGGEDFRRRIAVVSQHTHLFTGTIRENLLLACPEANQERLEQACRAAEIHDFMLERCWLGLPPTRDLEQSRRVIGTGRAVGHGSTRLNPSSRNGGAAS